jgi:hypothetical protein
MVQTPERLNVGLEDSIYRRLFVQFYRHRRGVRECGTISSSVLK